MSKEARRDEVPQPARIHPAASVDPRAELGPSVVVGPFAVIAGDVVVGRGTRIGPHVILQDGVRIGEDNEISAGALIGLEPQDRRFAGEESYVTIGHRNLIRELVTIARGTGEGQSTIIGNDSYILSSVHLGHNVRIGDRVTVVTLAQLAGHVQVDDDAYVGGMAGIHQFVRVGRMAMLGGYSGLRQDCPPYVLAVGVPARARGLNLVGLRRNGVPPRERGVIRRVFEVLYRSGLTVSEALGALERELAEEPLAQEVVRFIRGSQEGRRGVIRWGRKTWAGEPDEGPEAP